ncbi:MAG: hypothetical protein HY710_00960 [Candidatus Latescibacteria bacterium]|nr:hypothetical protein [Candidatus Latescibacterota bacterium]
MSPPFWANRILSYWTPYDTDHLVEYIEQLHPQVLQIGHFGPLFFSMCATDQWNYFGVPVRGMEEGIEWWKGFVADVQQLGIKVVGVFSLCFHFGDHETNEGWFRFWNDLWDEERLGPRPCDDPLRLLQINEDGTYKYTARGPEIKNQYCGCLNNPYWIETLKRMVRHAIQEIGLDGFNTVYNYVMGCCCPYCQDGLRTHLTERYSAADLKKFGIDEISTHTFRRIPFHYDARTDGPFELECVKFTHRSLKRTYDYLFTEYGRSLKPDLIAATWYHLSGDDTFGQLSNDERSSLPSDLWGNDENYFWYCISRQDTTQLQDGYTGDATLEAKYFRATGRGKPFIPNKYDDKRYPLSVAESVASGGAAIDWHWDTNRAHPPEVMKKYIETLGGSFRFVERHDSVYHPVESYADTALVFSRTSVQVGYPLFARTMRRLSRRLIDGHILFDIVIDDQLDVLSDQKYHTMIFPDVRYIPDERLNQVRAYLSAGGHAILTESSFLYDDRGDERGRDELADLLLPDHDSERFSVHQYGSGTVVYIPDVPRDERVVTDQARLVGPPIGDDPFGQEFVRHVRSASTLLTTDAPWTAVFHAYRQQTPDRLILHAVNYDRDETAQEYTPIPTGEIVVQLRLPQASTVNSIVYSSPDHEHDSSIAFTQDDNRVSFLLPSVRVYGLSVINLGQTII